MSSYASRSTSRPRPRGHRDEKWKRSGEKLLNANYIPSRTLGGDWRLKDNGDFATDGTHRLVTGHSLMAERILGLLFIVCWNVVWWTSVPGVITFCDTYKRQYLESDRKTESQKQMYQIVYFLRWNAIIGIGIVGACLFLCFLWGYVGRTWRKKNFRLDEDGPEYHPELVKNKFMTVMELIYHLYVFWSSFAPAVFLYNKGWYRPNMANNRHEKLRSECNTKSNYFCDVTKNLGIAVIVVTVFSGICLSIIIYIFYKLPDKDEMMEPEADDESSYMSQAQGISDRRIAYPARTYPGRGYPGRGRPY